MNGREATYSNVRPQLFNDMGPRVFTIPPAASFLDVLAQTLLAELDQAASPFGLSDAIILLPTKRAARALAQAFLDARGGGAILLPRIRTIGDIDPDDAGLAELGEGLSLTPTIDPMARRLTLARLIRARDRAADWSSDPVAALGAADALAELLDSAAITAPTDTPFDWSVLDSLVEDKNLAQHWEQSTTFLQIVTQMWPKYLADLDRADPGVRQRRGIEALIENWRMNPPKGCVILAGSTGSMPITRQLMACVARLPSGCVVLPGLDTSLSDANWDKAAIDDQHPQRAMAQSLASIGVTRGQVSAWPGAIETGALRQRRVVLNEALTPGEATSDWPSRIIEIGKEKIARGLEGLALVEASTEEEEANLIALELRETLEHDGQTAALVTPDANIARRVAAKLARWGIKIDVSAGKALSDTQTGVFIRLATAWASDPAEPVALASLLNHPLTCAGFERELVRKWASVLEINLLRGARKDVDLAHMRSRLNAMDPKYVKCFGDDTPSEAMAAIDDLITALNKIITEAGPIEGTLDQVARQVAGLCEALAAKSDASGAQVLWRGEEGEAAAQFLASLIENGAAFDAITTAGATRTLDYLMQGQVVRPRGTHPQLAILGPLEARLLRFDKLVLAGLDEGVWPKAPPPDPFLSRAMRAKLKLPSQDTRIGLSAHDFAQLAGAPRVILTRSKRRGDGPAVMSRWLWRLKTLTRGALGQVESDAALTPSPNWRETLRRNEPNRTFDTGLAIPRPKPPLHARPREFSATQVETWIRDPYRTYVEKILLLRALDQLGGLPGAGERGSAIHAATEIVGEWRLNLPDNPLGTMRAAMHAQLELAGYSGTKLTREMARLDASIAWLVPFELDRLAQDWFPHIEQWGRLDIDLEGGPLTIKAKADRIDVGPQGVEVLDFKSGTPPTAQQIMVMLAAQLPITALIVARGGYKNVPARTPTNLAHIHIGGRDPKVVGGVHKDTNVPDLIAKIESDLAKLFAKYQDEDMPYLSKPRVKFIKATSYEDATDRLARRTEWADVEGEAS